MRLCVCLRGDACPWGWGGEARGDRIVGGVGGGGRVKETRTKKKADLAPYTALFFFFFFAPMPSPDRPLPRPPSATVVHAVCWACDADVCLPEVGGPGGPPPLRWACDWCGAVTEGGRRARGVAAR